MLINRIFLGFMVVVGIAAGVVLVAHPASRDVDVVRYLWILVAMAVFEMSAYTFGRGAPGAMISMDARLVGFVIGAALMVLIPMVAGAPAA